MTEVRDQISEVRSQRSTKLWRLALRAGRDSLNAVKSCAGLRVGSGAMVIA
jgi:hypothetical protein